jgi:hypothetical protein
MDDFPIAFVQEMQDPPGLEVRVNFGVLAGRGASPAEIDRLGELLVGDVGAISIVSEERHQIAPGVEASVHQVRIELPETADGLEERVLDVAERWARDCADDRSVR